MATPGVAGPAVKGAIGRIGRAVGRTARTVGCHRMQLTRPAPVRHTRHRQSQQQTACSLVELSGAVERAKLFLDLGGFFPKTGSQKKVIFLP